MSRSGSARFVRATLAIFSLTLVSAADSAIAEGPYVASRTQTQTAAAPRPAAAMRIGSLDAATERQAGESRAVTHSSASPLVVRRGLTPAGGLTVELDGRFTTHVVIEAQGDTSGARCAAGMTSDRR